MADDRGYQTSAIDPDQVSYADREARRTEQQRASLWRFVLSSKLGREFIAEVLLADLGVLGPIVTDRDVPLHNLGVQWLRRDIRRHRELYQQLLAEQSKREDDARRAEETTRAGWARGDEETTP